MAKKYNNPFLFSAIVIAVAVIAGGVVLWHNKVSNSELASSTTSLNDKSSSQSTDQNDDQPTSNSDQSVPSKTADNQTPTQVTEPSKSSTNGKQITGVVSHSAIAGDQLQIRVLINQLLTSGTCKLTLTNASGKTYNANADVVSNPSSATCQGFNVPLSQLSSGNWNISIYVTSGTKQGVITGQTKI